MLTRCSPNSRLFYCRGHIASARFTYNAGALGPLIATLSLNEPSMPAVCPFNLHDWAALVPRWIRSLSAGCGQRSKGTCYNIHSYAVCKRLLVLQWLAAHPSTNLCSTAAAPIGPVERYSDTALSYARRARAQMSRVVGTAAVSTCCRQAEAPCPGASLSCRPTQQPATRQPHGVG